MPKEFARERRVADFVQRELATILQREMKDPRVGMVSINEVRVSPDLGYADLYVSALGVDDDAGRRALVETLDGAAGWLRSLLAKRSSMRTTPRLRFHWDAVPERGRALDALIDAARESDRARGAHAPDDDPASDDHREH